MAAEFYIAVLIMYSIVGWCTIQLHSHMGYFLRFSGISLLIVRTLIFALWPVSLPIFVEAFGQMIRGDD